MAMDLDDACVDLFYIPSHLEPCTTSERRDSVHYSTPARNHWTEKELLEDNYFLDDAEDDVDDDVEADDEREEDEEHEKEGRASTSSRPASSCFACSVGRLITSRYPHHHRSPTYASSYESEFLDDGRRSDGKSS